MSYQIVNLRSLHSGGNGDLFIGQRSDNGEHVVVKYLREYRVSHARKAFAREVRILARGLRGLMPLLLADMKVERAYYVMPYLMGGSLTRYAGRLTDGQLHNIAEELALTLAALHASYVAHGDFKPDNILVSADGRLQVADPLGNGFGCTVLFSEHHGGTPGYWAPEVRAGGPISYPGDAYSYGATLYELLTGRRPRDGQRLDPSAEGFVNAPKIQQIVIACCQSDPRSRPNMQEVLRMLRGEDWKDIQVARKQRQELVSAACVIGGLVLLRAVLTALRLKQRG
jgi:serine/threonine protein kinase